MSRPITAPRPGEAKTFPLSVHESVAFDLHVYCEALPAHWTKVINRAVRELIDRTLAENTGFRERFEHTRARLMDVDRRQQLADSRDRLRLVKKSRSTTKRRNDSVKRPKRPGTN